MTASVDVKQVNGKKDSAADAILLSKHQLYILSKRLYFKGTLNECIQYRPLVSGTGWLNCSSMMMHDSLK